MPLRYKRLATRKLGIILNCSGPARVYYRTSLQADMPCHDVAGFFNSRGQVGITPEEGLAGRQDEMCLGGQFYLACNSYTII